MAVVGPLWTGPLHCAAFVDAMVAESARHSWVQGLAEGYGRRPAGERFRPKGNSVYPFRDLPDLLALMREETQPGLHPFFYKLDDVRCPLSASLRKPRYYPRLSSGHSACIRQPRPG